MTLVQEATEMIQTMPEQNLKVVVDLLKSMTINLNLQDNTKQSDQAQSAEPFKRTGKASFVVPPDFDEHFDDANEEIAAMFYGE